MREPLIHSRVTGGFPINHPLAFTPIKCRQCEDEVHDATNQCLQTWVQTGNGPYCLLCFGFTPGIEELEDQWALEDEEAVL